MACKTVTFWTSQYSGELKNKLIRAANRFDSGKAVLIVTVRSEAKARSGLWIFLHLFPGEEGPDEISL